MESPDEHRRPETSGPIRLYTAAQSVSATGSWMQRTAMGWLAWDLTHSAPWVGALALMELISLIWVTPLAGTLADRRSPYKVFITTQSLLLVSAMSLGLLTAFGALSIGLLLAFALVEATLNGFNNPVRMTAINYLAGEGRISNAIAMNSLAVGLARSVGPAVAGFLILHGGAAPVFALNSASFLAMILVIRHHRGWLDRPPSGKQTSFMADIGGGFAYIAKTPDIAVIFLIAAAFSMLARPFAEMLPVFAGQVFAGGPQTLGMLLTAQGLGAMAGSAIMIRRHGARPLAPLVAGSGVGLSLFIVLFASTTRLHLALGALFVAGVFHVMCNISLQSLTQLRADPAFRGRALSMYSLMFRSGPSAGAFVIGMASPLLGLRPLVGGSAALAGVLIFLISRRAAKTGAKP
jgi:predicted MFS family arabinose efflux permease